MKHILSAYGEIALESKIDYMIQCLGLGFSSSIFTELHL